LASSKLYYGKGFTIHNAATGARVTHR